MTTTMLEKAIEIEGLIRILRDGEPSPEAYDLLRRKTAELAEIAARLPESAVNPEACAPEDRVFSSEDRVFSVKEKPTEVTSSENAGDDDDIFISADIEDEEEVHPAEKNLKSAFSLNDRYLFSRELFDGNMKMFDATLKFLEGIENFADIEDYFYNELQWDPDNSNVAAFLEILRPHFRE